MKFTNERGKSDSWMGVTVVGTTIPEDAPAGHAEKVKKHHEAMKQMIAEKKYKFIKTFENPPGGQKEYSPVLFYILQHLSPHCPLLPIWGIRLRWPCQQGTTKETRNVWAAYHRSTAAIILLEKHRSFEMTSGTTACSVPEVA